MAFVQIEDITGSAEMIVFPRILTENAASIKEDLVVRIEGRVSAREDEAPKIICDTALKVDPDYDGEPTDRTQVKMQKPQANKKSSARPGLYLKCTSISSPEFEQAKKVLRVFDGLTPVYVFCTDGSGLMSAPRELWVMLNDVMTDELERILGKDNVKIVE